MLDFTDITLTINKISTFYSLLYDSRCDVIALTHDTSYFICFPASGELVCPVLQYP